MSNSIDVVYIGIPGPAGPILANYADWHMVTGAGPYQADPSLPAIAFDGTNGAGTVLVWVPSPGDILVVRDFNALAGSAPITVTASTGWTIESPTSLGTYSGSAVLTTVGISARWKASSSLQRWILW